MHCMPRLHCSRCAQCRQRLHRTQYSQFIHCKKLTHCIHFRHCTHCIPRTYRVDCIHDIQYNAYILYIAKSFSSRNNSRTELTLRILDRPTPNYVPCLFRTPEGIEIDVKSYSMQICVCREPSEMDLGRVF